MIYFWSNNSTWFTTWMGNIQANQVAFWLNKRYTQNIEITTQK